MTFEEFKKKELPDNPGVYFFLGTKKEILYIGKATSLRDRVRSYFLADLIETRGRLLVDMLTLASNIEYKETDSVLEALLLEANLIKKYQPRYNTIGKDNKSYSYVVITDEDFPKVLIMRGRALFGVPEGSALRRVKHTFGPFPHGSQLREAMKIIRRIFPYSDDKCTALSGRPCFNRHLGLCPGVCTGEISKKEYAERIKNIKLLFEGKKKILLRDLEKQMRDFAKKEEFEKAVEIRTTVFALTHINDIALLKKENKIEESVGGDAGLAFRIEAYDVAHISGTNVVGVMVVVEDGEPNKAEYRKFKIKQNPGVNDTAALGEVLRRRLNHPEWRLPNIIAVDGGQAQVNSAEAAVKERGVHIPIVAVVKDERHKPREIFGEPDIVSKHGRAIILANSEAHRFAIAYHRNRRDRLVP